ncbi:MAG: response regulator transcription factor [Deltaproteobacteria bacterium]|nr:response regulator transcription factor [Deltaproteobacteria bacterium]
MQILVVDDDVELCELLRDYLTSEGFAVELAHDGPAGLVAAVSDRSGLVVLDVMLPGLSGFEVLRRLRERSAVPVVMLTARGDDVDRIVGLEMGADDYLPKPFNPRELVARIRAILRRAEKPSGSAPEGEGLAVGDVELRRSSRTVLRGGEEVVLTGVEFALLDALLSAAGRVVSRDELARKVLGREHSPYDRSIDVHVSNLRRKLGPSVGGGERIKTVRGSGYVYAAGG